MSLIPMAGRYHLRIAQSLQNPLPPPVVTLVADILPILSSAANVSVKSIYKAIIIETKRKIVSVTIAPQFTWL
jgi:hypothetical protein